jgi:hypothetical protein
MPKEPCTPGEWQDAVDAATGLRAIADCMMYGLMQGGPKINVARCDEILEQGRARRVLPSKPATVLACEVIAALNAEKLNA